MVHATVFRGVRNIAKKATTTFVMSVRPFVSIEQLDTHSYDFHLIWHLRIFRKSVEKNSIFIKI